ncbi:MAG: hypothetical protein ACRC9R_12460 [Enterovibrio sp.]
MLIPNKPNSWQYIVTTANRPVNRAQSVIFTIRGVSVKTDIITSSTPAGRGLMNVRQRIIAHPLSTSQTVTRQEVLAALMAHTRARRAISDEVTRIIRPLTTAMTDLQAMVLPPQLTPQYRNALFNAFETAYRIFVQNLERLLVANTITQTQALALLREGSYLKDAAMKSLMDQATVTNRAEMNAISADVARSASNLNQAYLVQHGITLRQIITAIT